MGDHHDQDGVLCVDPGTQPGHPRKRVRVDKGDNAYTRRLYIRPRLEYPRYDLGLAAGAGQNVLAYGAVGGGVVDDTAAFNLALASGCDVYIPPGIFLIAGQLSMAAGSGLVGQCGFGSRLNFSSNVAGALITAASNTNMRNFRLTYSGTNYLTNTFISINGTAVSITGINMQTADQSPAYGVSFDIATQNSKISDSVIHGSVIAIRYTAAYLRSILYSNFLNTGTAGTVINTTNAGANNIYAFNTLRTNGGAISYVVAGVAATFIANQSTSTPTAYTGAGLAASTVFDQSSVVPVNTTAFYQVDGTQVVSNRKTGWLATTQVANPTADTRTAVVDVASVTGTEEKKMAMLLNFLLTDLKATSGHGLINDV